MGDFGFWIGIWQVAGQAKGWFLCYRPLAIHNRSPPPPCPPALGGLSTTSPRIGGRGAEGGNDYRHSPLAIRSILAQTVASSKRMGMGVALVMGRGFLHPLGIGAIMLRIQRILSITSCSNLSLF